AGARWAYSPVSSRCSGLRQINRLAFTSASMKDGGPDKRNRFPLTVTSPGEDVFSTEWRTGMRTATAVPGTVSNLSYRIGFLAAAGDIETTPRSLLSAAERLAHCLVPIADPDELASAKVDFLLARPAARPRPRDVPTFAIIDEAKDGFSGSDEWLDTLSAYDGYLTVSEAVRRLLRGLCLGAGRERFIGSFASTPDRQFVTCRLERLIELGALRLCCFGANRE